MTEELEVKQETPVCRRCGRKLKNPTSVELGFGVTCYKKFMATKKFKTLFTVNKKGVNDSEATTGQSVQIP